MASIARYVSGDTNPMPVLCDPNYPIEVGDLLFREPSNNLARPASAMVNQGSADPQPAGVPRPVPGRGLAEERRAARRDRAAEQHDQPQPGQRDRSAPPRAFSSSPGRGHRLQRRRLGRRRPNNTRQHGLQDQVVSQVTAVGQLDRPRCRPRPPPSAATRPTWPPSPTRG